MKAFFTVPSSVIDIVSDELSKISAQAGIGNCLITGEMEDYSQYIVRGYYAGDPQLERYFRAMMWYGRIGFRQSMEDLDRSALLMTLALDGDTKSYWEAIYAVTAFFAGESDDCGYYEYRPVIDAAYGADNSGTNDATKAIQKAIDAACSAGGGVVYLPAGTYKVNPTSYDQALHIYKSAPTSATAGRRPPPARTSRSPPT